jgi:thiol-disulfide isomerase/thioredoxin
MQSRLIVALPALIFLLIAGCARKEPPVEGSTSSGKAIVADVMNVVKRSDRAPNFSWKDSTGKVIDFDSYRGKVTVVNFWATWCGPCKKELPDLVALSRELADHNVRFIGVSTDRGPNIIEDVRTFVIEHGIPYPNIVSNDDLEEAFGNPRAIPTSYLIDADGKIAQTFVGLRSKDFFAQAITPLLK